MISLDARAIAQRYAAGESVDQLARAYGCSTGPVRRVLRELKIPMRKGGHQVGAPSLRRRFTSQQERTIIRRYRAGESASTLAVELRVVRGTVLGVLRRADVDVRRRRVPDETLLKLAKRYEAGEKMTALAREVGYRRAGLYEAFKALNVPLRGPGPQPTRPPQKAGRRVGGVGPRHNRWSGGRQKATGGYLRLWMEADDPLASMRNSRGYVLEHRLVIARSLGRPLGREETVHHINSDKTDNRLENLQLRHGRHGNGHALVCADCGSHNIIPSPLT